MGDKIKIMIESNTYNMVTGYSRVIREVMFRLAKDAQYEIFHLGQQYQGMPTKNQNVVVLPLIDNNVCIRQKWVDKIKPDYYLWIEDSFTMENQNGLDLNLHGGKLVLYVPEDGTNSPTVGLRMMKKADKLIAMSNFGREVMEKDGLIVDAVIYHGVDTNIFKPATDEDKKTIKKKAGFKETDKIILFIGRNSARKLPQTNFDILAKFLIKHPAAKYFVHIPDFLNPTCNLADYVKRCLPMQFGKEFKDMLGKQIFFSNLASSLSLGIDDKQISHLYQMADIYATFASGEGFGFPLIEAAACGVPIVATDYTTTHELVVEPKTGLASKPITTWASSYNVRHAMPNVDASVADLETLYTDSKLRKELSNNGLSFVKEKCDWDSIVEQWKEVFKPLVVLDE